MIKYLRIFALCHLLFCTVACANEEDTLNFASELQTQQYETLLKEMRCVTCPNQSLADSAMPIAMGMKAEIYQQVRENKSSAAIKAYFVDRYGKKVLYKPPYERSTLLLWLMPFLLLLISIVLWRSYFKASLAHG